MTFEKYLDHYDRKWLEVMTYDADTATLGASIHKSVATTWSMTFEYLRRVDEKAARLLHVMAFLNGQDISFDLFDNIDPERSCKADQDFEDEAEFLGMMRSLLALSLVQKKVGSVVYEVHPVLQDWCIASASPEELDENFVLALHLIGSSIERSYYGVLGDRVNRKKQILPADRLRLHCSCCMKPFIRRDFLSTVQLPHNMCELLPLLDHFFWVGSLSNLKDAEFFHRTSFVARNDLLGHQDPKTLDNALMLGVVLFKQRKYTEAEEILSNNLEHRMSYFGPRSLETQSCRLRLAMVQLNRRQYRRAEENSSAWFSVAKENNTENQETTALTASRPHLGYLFHSHPERALAIEVSQSLRALRNAPLDETSTERLPLSRIAKQVRQDIEQAIELEKLGRSKEALEALPKNFELDLDKMDVHTISTILQVIARLTFSLGMLIEATIAYQKVLSIFLVLEVDLQNEMSIVPRAGEANERLEILLEQELQPPFNLCCGGCSRSIGNTVMGCFHRCLNCWDVDFCNDCFVKHTHGDIVVVDHQTKTSCSSCHKFLLYPRPIWKDLKPGAVDLQGTTFLEWLRIWRGEYFQKMQPGLWKDWVEGVLLKEIAKE